MPPALPPLVIPHGLMITSHIPAMSTLGFFASIERLEHPVFTSTKAMRFHVAPPSVVLKTPRSSCGPVALPNAQTKTTWALSGCTMMREMRPLSLSPMFCQVAPASVDLYTPSPMMSDSRTAHPSPVPAHTTFVLLCATASAPMACTGWLSKMGRKVVPPSVVFQTPPDAEPMYQVEVSP